VLAKNGVRREAASGYKVSQTGVFDDGHEGDSMSNQPRVFVASSSEGLHVAEAVVIKLEHDAKVKLWDNAFDLSSMTITSLVARAQDTDFAVFIFHRDDKTTIRGSTYSVIRDNVLFELGLFIGALGVDRCFILVPKSSEGDFRLPTDLAGVTVSTYDDGSDDMVDAVAASCAKMKIALRKLMKESEGPAQGQESEDAKLTVVQKQLQAVQSELWRLRIDAERAQEEKAKLLHAVTAYFYGVAKPATEAEISAWEEGAKVSYPSGPMIRRHKVYLVDRDVIVPPLYGALSISVIAAVGVKIYGLDQWSHNSIYLMDGFRKLE
jgi:predicted nucleotide-binding protein